MGVGVHRVVLRELEGRGQLQEGAGEDPRAVLIVEVPPVSLGYSDEWRGRNPIPHLQATSPPPFPTPFSPPFPTSLPHLPPPFPPTPPHPRPIPPPTHVIHYIYSRILCPNKHFCPIFCTRDLWAICSILLIHFFFTPFFVSEIGNSGQC